MSNNDNSSSSAPPTTKKRRNRRPRSLDAAAALFDNPGKSGSGSLRPHLQPSSLPPLAPRGHGQGQGQHGQNGGGSGLHQTIHNHYHYSPYEGFNRNGSGGSDSSGGGGPYVAGYESGTAATMADLRVDRRYFVYGPAGGPGSQGYGLPVAHSNVYGPAPAGPSHPGWYGQHGPAGGGEGGGSQQGASRSVGPDGGPDSGPDGGFVVALGWGRSPYGA
ncbi:hypothetical protein IWX90DRAFT_184705 [Phyllosticta citrichinensis]|uniref:Uncharacterized protein n=1 Tax=Phyllosticta citrichinensis TaxID=1130410 RepID=A0ABR1XW31_9PEZI